MRHSCQIIIIITTTLASLLGEGLFKVYISIWNAARSRQKVILQCCLFTPTAEPYQLCLKVKGNSMILREAGRRCHLWMILKDGRSIQAVKYCQIALIEVWKSAISNCTHIQEQNIHTHVLTTGRGTTEIRNTFLIHTKQSKREWEFTFAVSGSSADRWKTLEKATLRHIKDICNFLLC